MSLDIIRRGEEELRPVFNQFDEVAYENQQKVLNMFRLCRIREEHFQASSGYGYGDQGRERLEELYAGIFGAEDALVRAQIVSGTHAIAACLFALLRPGDTMVSASGPPYDTLANIIGLGNDTGGTLTERGIKYREVPLLKNGTPDFETIPDLVDADTKLVFIQRSRGYQLRPALPVAQIEKICALVKSKNSGAITMVDNCYGEFTAVQEPSETGADITAGSLIKNPGGGLALNGGYIVGKKDLIEQIAWHLTAPGLGKNLGATLFNRRYYYMGLFMAPHAVQQSLMGATLAAWVAGYCGYETYPGWNEPRADIVQAIKVGGQEQAQRFCQLIQRYSPVDSDVTLEFGSMPGYESKVIMAAGTFVQGSSIELSCDAPMREPYCVFLQGGLTYQHCRYVMNQVLESGLLK